MPLLNYLCPCNKSVSKFWRVVKEAPSRIVCECGLEMKKQLSAPSNSSKVVVDNGVQSKSVEVDLAVVADNEANSIRDFREKS